MAFKISFFLFCLLWVPQIPTLLLRKCLVFFSVSSLQFVLCCFLTHLFGYCYTTGNEDSFYCIKRNLMKMKDKATSTPKSLPVFVNLTQCIRLCLCHSFYSSTGPRKSQGQTQSHCGREPRKVITTWSQDSLEAFSVRVYHPTIIFTCTLTIWFSSPNTVDIVNSCCCHY